MCYGFNTFSEASYAGWSWTPFGVRRSLTSLTSLSGEAAVDFQFFRAVFSRATERFGISWFRRLINPATTAKVGIQVDIAADTFYNKQDRMYYGLLSAEPKSKDDLLRLYEEMVANWPFVDIEDPFNEDDYESHAELVKTRRHPDRW